MKRILKNIFCVQLLLITYYSCDNPNKVLELALHKDDYYEKCRKLILSENKIGQEYFFKITKREIDEFTLIYLGSIVNSKKDTLKFLSEINYSGIYEDSKHASSYMYVYNAQNTYIGHYYFGSISRAPTKLDGFNLIFSYNNKTCNQTTEISFKDSIPHQIFIKCTEKGGDFYSFTKE